MWGEWEETTLGACADQLAGFAFKSKSYVADGSGVHLLRGDNIAPGAVRWAGVKTYPAELTDGLERYQLAAGDIVVAMDRPWIDAGLKVARLRDEDIPSMLVQRVTRLRALPHADQGFLWAVVCSPAFSSRLRSETTGTAVPHISGKQIAEFPLLLPPLDEQRAIAAVLGAIDDKIKSNRRTSDLARQNLMQVLPRHGNPTPLTDVAAFVNGGALTKQANGGGRPILRIKELRAGVSPDTPRTDAEVRPDHEVSFGDLLFS